MFDAEEVMRELIRRIIQFSPFHFQILSDIFAFKYSIRAGRSLCSGVSVPRRKTPSRHHVGKTKIMKLFTKQQKSLTHFCYSPPQKQ